MKYSKSNDFINAINGQLKEDSNIYIELILKKYGFCEKISRSGEWNGKRFRISGSISLKNVELEWEEEIYDLLEQLEGIEINELGEDFYGWSFIESSGGYPEPDDEGIEWISEDGSGIKLDDKEYKEFEKEGGIENLWDQAGMSSEESEDSMLENGGMLKIIVKIDEKVFALVSKEYFDECDDLGNWK